MTKRGFTLIEVIIYLGLFAMLIGGAVVGSYQLLAGGAHNEKRISIQEEGTFLNRKLSWALSGATSAVAGTPTTLTIVRPDLGAQSPLVFNVSDGVMTLKRGAAASTTLNDSRYALTNTMFVVEPAAAGKPAGVSSSFMIGDQPFVFKKYLR